MLVVCQGLFLTNNVTLLAVNGLVGLRLASTSWLATLPLMMYVVGGAVFAAPVAKSQRLWGRKRSFQIGLLVAIMASAGCAYATATANFPLLLAASLLAGFYSANASLYRFAAAELVEAPFRLRAISWVMAGGIIGAVAGPNLSSWSKDFTAVPFVGAYLALVAVAVVGLLLMTLIDFPPLETPSNERPARSVWQIARQPVFIIAAICSSLGFGVMSLLMAATPIAMDRCGFSFANTALVLEWHVLGMFVPSFFTGTLIKRLGMVPVLAMGVALFAGCVVVALSGVELMQFLLALLLLGVGWNFLYVGGSTLLTKAYEPHEKTTAQGAMDFCVFVVMAITALSSGALVTSGGWQWMNVGAVLPISVLAMAVVWLALQQRKSVAVQS